MFFESKSAFHSRFVEEACGTSWWTVLLRSPLTNPLSSDQRRIPSESTHGFVSLPGKHYHPGSMWKIPKDIHREMLEAPDGDLPPGGAKRRGMVSIEDLPRERHPAQVSKGLEKTSGNTGKIPQNWNRLPKKPSWAKPDADSQPDPWDDEE